MKNPKILDLYSDYLIASFKMTTATGMSALLNEALSHDKISRFLGQGQFTQKDYWKCVKPIIRQIESDYGIIKIDDTILEKPHSTENDIICWHYDHSKKSKDKNVKGMNILNFLYQSSIAELNYVSAPVAFEIIKKTEPWYDKKSDKVKRRSAVSKNQMVQERLKVLQHYNKLKFRYVLWDTWFTSADNLKFVHHELKKYFVVALKSNRKMALSQEDKRQGKWIRADQMTIQKDQAILVWLKGLDFPVQLVKQVFQNKDGSSGELYLITNDLSLTAELISATYQSRWGVEELHKSLKQNVGLEQSPTKFEITQSNHVFAAMIAWVKLELLSKIKQTNHFALKNQLYLHALKESFKQLQLFKSNQLKLTASTAQTNPLLG